MRRKLSQEETIIKFKNIHGENKFDYSKVVYIDNNNKILIICNTCKHEFLQIPRVHKQGHGCPKCAGCLPLPQQDVIAKFKLVHGESKYDYHKVHYINDSVKITIICNICNNQFRQTPNMHKKGNGCPKCSGRLLSTKDIIEQFIQIHGEDNYDYSKMSYKKDNEKILIICKKCNSHFFQTPNNHKSGHGCRKCNGGISLTKEEIINQFKQVHGDQRYDYSKVNYINDNTKIIIVCNLCHHEFNQAPNTHKIGRGCPHCIKRISKPEYLWLNSLGVPDDPQHRQVGLPNLRISVDGYDPNTKTVYEFHGDYWHGNPNLYDSTFLNKVSKKTMGELYEKTINRENRIKNAGYNLVVIWENEWYKQQRPT